MRRCLSFAFVALIAAAPLAAQNEPPVIQQGAGSYTLRPGDLVQITVWGQDDYSGRFQVDEEGRIHYPVVGAIDTRNMTLGALRDTLRASLQQLFTNPFVTITPLFRIAVLGQVRNPGLYTVDPTLSVLDIVALAGGPTSVGNLDKIRVFRSGSETQFSFQQESVKGRTLQEVGIRSGDEIIVPRRFFTREDFGLLLQIAQLALTVALFFVTLGK